MPLILALRKGHDFYVGNHRVVVSDIKSAYEAVLKLDGGGFTTVNDVAQLEIYPNVTVMVGTPRNQNQKSIIKLLLDGPGKEIVRGDVYRKTNKVSGSCLTCKGTGILKTQVTCPHCGGFGCSACHGTGKIEDVFQCPDCGEAHETE